MSLNATRYTKKRHLCACGRHALFSSNVDRRLRYRPDHPLCMRCWRGVRASVAVTPRPGLRF